MSSPGWYPDPAGRYEWRWFDGAHWTPKVASGGQSSVDMLSSSPAHVGVVVPAPAVIPYQYMVPVLAPQNPLATAGLVLGILAVVCSGTIVLSFFGVPMGILALIFGLIARPRAERLPGRVGRGKAIAAIVLGIVSLVWLVLVVAAVVVFSGGS
jgi:Protein of unknown function (DUF2510)/Domain of unknown function (DUF4190)